MSLCALPPPFTKKTTRPNCCFTLNNLINPINKTYDYSKIKSLLKTDEIELFLSTNWKCGDFKQPCLYKVKKNYIIEFKNNYLFIQTSDKETL